ncbi:MAG: V-type ATP synthase subunit E family protein [Thermotaleaceae bacterium]
MITIEEKFNVFTKLVFERIQQESQGLLQKMEESNQQILKAKEKELTEQKDWLIEEMLQKGKARKNQMIAKANMEKRIKLLEKKQELLQQLLLHIKKKAVVFTEEQEYEVFLKKNLDTVLESLREEKALTLYVTPKDLQSYKEMLSNILKGKGYENHRQRILEAEEDILGGMIVLNEEKTLRIDVSILSLIEDIEKEAGKRLYEVLEKEGEIRG